MAAPRVTTIPSRFYVPLAIVFRRPRGEAAGAVIRMDTRDTGAWSHKLHQGQVRSASVMNGDCVKLPLAAVVTPDHHG